MILVRVLKSGKIVFVKGIFKEFKELWIRHKCMKGKYYLVLQANWRNFIRQFAFSIYGPEVCDIKEVGSFCILLRAL